MTDQTSRAAGSQPTLFPSEFERDFLIRTLGDIVSEPEASLSELVANAWDAGASTVDIQIPSETGGLLSVVDDGCGLTVEEFKQRWMRLGYNRTRYQGDEVEFPPGRTGNRRAYGRNGQGRHGLLCFGDEYHLTIQKAGHRVRIRVATGHGDSPFESQVIDEGDSSTHGVHLDVVVTRHLPSPESIREALSSRFLHDPEFVIRVNGEALTLEEQPHLAEESLDVGDPISGNPIHIKLYVVEANAGRRMRQSGVAFWVGRRLVGDPGWSVLGIPIVDGRTRIGRRTTVVVKCDDLVDDVLPDWTGFRRTPRMQAVAHAVADAVERILSEVYGAQIEEATNTVLRSHVSQIETLGPAEQREVIDVARSIGRKNPLVSEKIISAAVEGIIQTKKDGSLQMLMARIQELPSEDQAGLSRLLREWSVKDALSVLDEVNRRIKTVEVISKVAGDSTIDELHVLHPLVAQARWLFGVEYDSSLYSFNLGLRNAVEALFKVKASSDDFDNSRKRPDLLVRDDGSIAAVSSEEYDAESGINQTSRVLLVELKKGGFKIGRSEMDQATGYIEDLIHSGHLTGTPFVEAVVVGHQLDSRTTTTRQVGDGGRMGRVKAATYTALVSTANTRLFRLREQVADKYPESAGDVLAHLRASQAEAEGMGIALPAFGPKRAKKQ